MEPTGNPTMNANGATESLDFEDMSSPPVPEPAPAPPATPEPQSEATPAKEPVEVEPQEDEKTILDEAAPDEPSLEDYLTEEAQEPADDFTPAPEAEITWKKVLREAGDEKKAPYVLAEKLNELRKETADLREQLASTSSAFDEAVPEAVETPEMREDLRWKLEAGAWKNFNEKELPAKVHAHLNNPKSPYSSYSETEIAEMLSADFAAGIASDVEKVLPHAIKSELERLNGIRQSKLSKLEESSTQARERFKAEQEAQANALDDRVEAMAEAIGENPLLRHLTMLELSQAEGPEKDEDRLVSAREKMSSLVKEAVTSDLYSKDKDFRKELQRMVLKDKDVRKAIDAKIKADVAAQAAPANSAALNLKSTDTSPAPANGYRGGRPEGHAASTSLSFEDMQKA